MRTERGWSRQQLAQEAEVSYSYLGHIETGRHYPSSPVLDRVARALGVAPSELLARAENKSSSIGTASGQRADRWRDDEPEDPASVSHVAIEDDSESTFAELRELMNRMSAADRDRLLDLARRLAH